ncbi:MAG TPA: hypothetical protein VGR14_10005 [Verrucomicrobiae bacterium]|jgi:ParB-like chromosome segregation protein Spo0J|nr:hypothetical protein [Verrucomicrobiae bacterium]
MIRPSVKYIVTAAILMAGCGLRHASVDDPLPADQLAAVLQNAFQSADASAREAVQRVVKDVEQHQVAAAFTDIKELAAEANLTKDQRITAIRAANTIGQQLQEAAQNGDTNAVETIQSYKASH